MPPASSPGSDLALSRATTRERAARVRYRRALMLMTMTLVVPGSAQLAAGNRKEQEQYLMTIGKDGVAAELAEGRLGPLPPADLAHRVQQRRQLDRRRGPHVRAERHGHRARDPKVRCYASDRDCPNRAGQ